MDSEGEVCDVSPFLRESAHMGVSPFKRTSVNSTGYVFLLFLSNIYNLYRIYADCEML